MNQYGSNDRPGGGSDRPGGFRGNGSNDRPGGFREDRGSYGVGRGSGAPAPGAPGGLFAPRPGGGRGNGAPPLPQDYLQALKEGYYHLDPESGRNVLRREYVYGFPARIVERFDQRNADKSSQVRKFYDYAVRIRERLDAGASFAEVEANFCMLAAFANNAKERRTVSENFCRFIQANVDAVHNKEDLAAFVKHFEAVVAYLKK